MRPLKVRWLAQTDISVAEDDHLLQLLRDSGCFMLFIGFESVSRESLRTVDPRGFKIKRFERYSEYISKIQSLGIGVLGAFVLGFDTDDLSVFEKTSRFITDTYMYASQITVLTPLPGTRLREQLERENRLLDYGWDHFGFLDVNFMPKQMTPQQLQDGLGSVYRSVYGRENVSRTLRHFKEIYKTMGDGQSI